MTQSYCYNKNSNTKSQNNNRNYGIINKSKTHDVIDGKTYFIKNDNYYDNYYIRYNYYNIDCNLNAHLYKTEVVYQGTKHKTYQTIYKR